MKYNYYIYSVIKKSVDEVIKIKVMKQILNENKEVIFKGNDDEMTLAFYYLTKPFFLLSEVMGLKMADAYKLNKKYWNDKTRVAKSFTLESINIIN